jgi:DNA ligase-1
MQFQTLCTFISTCRTVKGKGSIKQKELAAEQLGKQISSLGDEQSIIDVLATLYPQNHPEKFMPIGLTTLAYLLRQIGNTGQGGRMVVGVSRNENPMDWVNAELCKGKGKITTDMIQRGIKLLYKTTGESKCRNLACVLDECTQEEGRLFCEIVGCTLTFGFGIKHFFDSWKIDSVGRTWIMSNNIPRVAKTIVSGVPCQLEPGYYISSMLARQKPFHDPIEAFNFIELKKRKLTQEVYAQLKIDGYRIQLHHSSSADRFWYFSRHNLDMGDTYFFKALNEHFMTQIPLLESYILDGEVIAYDKTKHDFIPCQEMSSFLWMSNPNIVLLYFVFDILYYEGLDCTAIPYTKRLQLLEKYIQPGEHIIPMTEGAEFMKIPLCMKICDPCKLKEYYSDVVAKALEGLLLKDPNSTWDPYARSNSHVKVKPPPESYTFYIVGCNINRLQLISSVLLAQKRNDHYYTVGYAGTGLTNLARAKLTELISESTTSSTKGGREVPTWLHVYGAERPHMYVHTPIECNTTAHKLLKSKIYTGGYTLRFPVIQEIPAIQFVKDKPMTSFDDPVPVDVGFITKESKVLDGVLVLIVTSYDHSLMSEIKRNILRMSGTFTSDLNDDVDVVIVPENKVDETELEIVRQRCTAPIVNVDWLRKTYLWNEKMLVANHIA